jgi:hypothetical protein
VGAGEKMNNVKANHDISMKTYRVTRFLWILAVLSFGVHPAKAQLKLPWENEAATKKPPVEAPPEAVPDPTPPTVEEIKSAAAATPVEAVYLAWADQIFANTNGNVRIGSPQTAAKKISVSVTLKGERITMVFLEKSNDGRKARVIAGPKDSEGDFFGLEKKANGWILTSWPAGFRGTGEDSEPESEPPPVDKPAITWNDLSSRRLDRLDLSGLSKAELRLLRNEVYARHGQIFSSEDLRTHFSQESWYRPRFKEVDDSKFSATLKYNIEMIRVAEKE